MIVDKIDNNIHSIKSFFVCPLVVVVQDPLDQLPVSPLPLDVVPLRKPVHTSAVFLAVLPAAVVGFAVPVLNFAHSLKQQLVIFVPDFALVDYPVLELY